MRWSTVGYGTAGRVRTGNDVLTEHDWWGRSVWMEWRHPLSKPVHFVPQHIDFPRHVSMGLFHCDDKVDG